MPQAELHVSPYILGCCKQDGVGGIHIVGHYDDAIMAYLSMLMVIFIGQTEHVRHFGMASNGCI
jgi:hypothetical protein